MSDWRVLHKTCYGSMLKTAGSKQKDNHKDTCKGITMSQYCEIFERKRKQKIEMGDNRLLKQLTTDTLFCEYCYRPYLIKDEKHIEKELTLSVYH